MIDIYYAPTPNGWKVAIMLEECELAYETIFVRLTQGDQFAAEYPIWVLFELAKIGQVHS